MMRTIFFALAVAGVTPASLGADQRDDDLQLILEEMEELHGQIQRLEQKVDGLLRRLEALSRRDARESPQSQPAVARPTRLSPPAPGQDVDEVLRMQILAPKRLLDGVREREERLRRREFLPEVAPFSRPSPILKIDN